MTTSLDGALKRALVVDGEPYTLTITPEGLNLVPKGRRKGYTLAWSDLVSGEAALATALNASLAGAPAARASVASKAPASAPAPASKAPASAPAPASTAPARGRRKKA